MLDLRPLRATFAGTILEPTDAAYEDARTLFNAMVEKRPAVIAQCTSIADVQAALAFARSNHLDVGVRSGGHGVTGAALTDGLVIDMRAMNAVSVDVSAATATVGGGATWGVVDSATQAHGLATTGGRVSTTGVAGLTLGGGSGWTERKWGLAADSLLEVKLVTADGSLVTANEHENTELFWALHGGGGNFGIAVEFTFQLKPLTDFYAALIMWPTEKGPTILRRYREFVSTAPEEVGGGFAFLTAPPEEFVPEAIQGSLVSAVIFTFMGTEEQAQPVLAPLLEFEEPLVAMPMAVPYTMFQSMIDDPPGFRNYWSVEHLTDLTDEVIDIFCEHGVRTPSPTPTQFVIFPWGGAVARGAEASPLQGREALWVVHPLGMWPDAADDERNIAWARSACAALKPFATGGAYLNFISEEGADRLIAGFGKANYERMQEVKRAFDPDNVFRGNQNIRPD
jgi:FAD/FMN-containing dehydrogenase